MNFDTLNSLLGSQLGGMSGMPQQQAPAPMPAMPMAAPMAAAPQMPMMPHPAMLPQKKHGTKDLLLQLAPMVAAAFMSGKDPNAAAAMLQGVIRGQEMARSQRMQRDEQERERDNARAKFLQSVAADAQQFDNPEEFQKYLSFAEQVGSGLGIEPGSLSKSIAFPASKLAKRTQSEAAAKIAELQKVYGENFDQVAESASVTFKGKPTKVSDLLRLAEMNLSTDKGPVSLTPAQSFGSMSDLEGAVKVSLDEFTEKNGRPPNAAERRTLYFDAQKALAEQKRNPGPAPNVGSFEDYVVRKYGENPTPEQITQARKVYQQADDRPRVTVDVGGLNPKVQTAISGAQRRYDSNPVVKRAATMAEAVDFVSSLPENSTNPADDQALIYAFAKAMDPESVVREGEYATVQKYSQSWLKSFGFNAQRVVSDSEFLSPNVRRNLKETIRKRFMATRAQYDNVRRQIGSDINRMTGRTDGLDYLTDYATGSQPSAAAPAPKGGGQKIGRFEVQVSK